MPRTELGFYPQGHHPYVYFGAALGLILFGITLIGFVVSKHGPFEIVGTLLGMSAAGPMLLSTAYAFWGRLIIVVDEDDWCTVTWRVGSLSRTKRFPRPDVRNVQVVSPAPSVLPSQIGKQVRLDVEHIKRPIVMGGGFDLDKEALQAIAKVFTDAGGSSSLLHCSPRVPRGTQRQTSRLSLFHTRHLGPIIMSSTRSGRTLALSILQRERLSSTRFVYR